MAVKKKSDFNTALLSGIGSGNVTHISKDDGLPLLQHNPPLIEVNLQQLDGAGNAAVRLTDAGKQMTNGAVHEAVASPYAIISNAVLPPSKRTGKGGGAPIQYPFETMEIGQSFHVPVSAKHKDPVKTLGSTVSSANMRFAVDTGEKKTVTRNKRGAKNKLVLDANGQPIPETLTVPVYKHTRRFTIRPVVAGVAYGGWTAPADGALIARVELKAE